MNNSIKLKAQNALIKKFRKTLFRPFIEAVKKYNLIEDNDYIMSCVSGGKDSIVNSLLLQELCDHGIGNFKLIHVMMNPGFKEEFVESVNDLYNRLGLQLHVFKTEIFQITEKMAKDNPCFLCARMRRGALYNEAQKLGANKIALGHHMDDVVETTMMNMCMQGSFKNMLPKLNSKNFPGISLIRPLYLIREDDIIKYKDYVGLDTFGCSCVLTDGNIKTSRDAFKDILKEIEIKLPGSKKNIQNSIANVYKDTCLGVK